MIFFFFFEIEGKKIEWISHPNTLQHIHNIVYSSPLNPCKTPKIHQIQAPNHVYVCMYVWKCVEDFANLIEKPHRRGLSSGHRCDRTSSRNCKRKKIEKLKKQTLWRQKKIERERESYLEHKRPRDFCFRLYVWWREEVSRSVEEEGKGTAMGGSCCGGGGGGCCSDLCGCCNGGESGGDTDVDEGKDEAILI